jgi:ApeA N-terminal domain 1
MSEKRDIAGLWWLPTNPDERWAGTLTLERDEEPRLIVNSQKGAFQFFGQELKAPPAIVGHDQNGYSISLLFPSWPRTFGGMALSQIEFSAHYAILGLELSHHDDFKVNELTFQMQHLLAWAGLTGFYMTNQILMRN